MLNKEIYQKVKQIIYSKYSYPINQYEPQVRYQIELAADSLEMYELMIELEQCFDITFDKDEIDNYYFQAQSVNYFSEIKMITIQETVKYIAARVQNSR